MRAARLVQLLLLLQSRGKLTASQLADELEVSVRTIYRDMEALSAAGVPVYAEAGPGGGCRLVDGYRTRLTGLTPDEAEALALAGLPGAAADLGLGTVLAAAQLKVDAALPPELRGRTTRMRERFHLDAPGWFSRNEEVPHLATVARGVWEERRLTIEYRRTDKTVDRTVDPLGLVLKAGRWYLVAATDKADDDRDERHVGGRALRTYRVARIDDAGLLDEHAHRPEDFDLAGHWTTSMADFSRSMMRHEVDVRLSPSAFEHMCRILEPQAAQVVRERAGRPDADGWVRTVVPVESYDYAHHDFLRLGADAEVLAPAELRQRLAGTALSMAARYAASFDPTTS
jgi:predicted DNA-binding transcriptional regulator YafY